MATVPGQTSVGQAPCALHFGVHIEPSIPVMVMLTSPAWHPAGWNGSSKWHDAALDSKSASGTWYPLIMLTSMAGAAKEATAKVDAAIILSMVVFSLDSH